MSDFISPDEIFAAAKKMMLEGKEPTTTDDYERLMNFFAWNVAPEVALPACRLLAVLYSFPLTNQQIANIVAFQKDQIRKERQREIEMN